MEAIAYGSSNAYASLNAAFAALESALRPALGTFLTQRGLEKSNDVRAMLGLLNNKWDDSAGAIQRTNAVNLPGSPLMSANFLMVKNVLNYYHHSSRTHWQIIEQGFQSAQTILQAFHDFASLDTAATREELRRLWEVAKASKQGDYAYDTSVKITVEEWPWASGSSFKVVLKNVPPDTTSAQISAALLGQEFNVSEERVQKMDGSKNDFIVSLNSEEERKSLLGMKEIPIRRSPVSIAMHAGGSAVAIYLPKEMNLEVVASVWDNQHYDLDKRHIAYDGDDKKVILVQITPAQLSKLKEKSITLLRKKIDLVPHAPFRLRFRLPSQEEASLQLLRAALVALIDQSDIIGLAVVPDSDVAVVHLRSHSAYERLLRERHLVVGARPDTAAEGQITYLAGPSSKPSEVAPAQVIAAANKGKNKEKNTPKQPVSPVKSSASGKEKKEKELKDKKEKGKEKEKEEKQAKASKGKTALILKPIPQNSSPQEIISQFTQQTKVALDFVTIRGNQAYVEVKASQAEGIEPMVTINGTKVNVGLHEGDIPLIKVGLSPSLPTTPKGQVTQAVIKAFSQQNAGRLGSILIGPDDIQVPVSTKECLTRLLKFGTLDILGHKLSIFDASSFKHEEILKDVLTMHYLKKERDELDRIQVAHSVSIALRMGYTSEPSEAASSRPAEGQTSVVRSKESQTKQNRGRGRGRGGNPANTAKGGSGRGATPTKDQSKGKAKQADIPKQKAKAKKVLTAQAHIKGPTRDKVNAALRDLRRLIDLATVKKTSFRFAPDQVSLCAILEDKVKEIGRKDPKIAIHCIKKPDATALEISMMGSDKAAVEQLATRPNHLRTKLVIETVPVSLQKKIDIKKLSKAFDVVLKLKTSNGELSVAGSREAVRACVESLKLDSAQLVLTSGKAKFYQEYLSKQFQGVQVVPTKKSLVVRGSAEDIETITQLTEKLELYNLPYRVAPQLADIFEKRLEKRIQEVGIAAIISAFIYEDESDGDDSDSDSDSDEDQDEDDLIYLSTDANEDEWVSFELWSLGVIPTNISAELCGLKLYDAWMPFFTSELDSVRRLNLSSIKSKLGVWTQLDIHKRSFTCFGFSIEAVDEAILFISDFLSKGNVRHPRLVYSLPMAMISLMVLRAHELNYLTFYCRGKQMVAVEGTDAACRIVQDNPLLFAPPA